MGKTLFIVRHAQAKPKEPDQRDLDRQLTSEGLHLSSRLGVYLSKSHVDISAIVCSNAERAKQTAEQIADQINFDVTKIEYDHDLYEASVRILLEKVCGFFTQWNEVIVIGHNPVLTYFVEYLTGHHFDGMEAGSLVKVACGVDEWSQVSNETATFEYYVSPRDLSDAR